VSTVQSITTSRAPHPDVLCDDHSCRECYCPPCPACKGKGELVALNPRGYAVITCPRCGGCGSQI